MSNPFSASKIDLAFPQHRPVHSPRPSFINPDTPPLDPIAQIPLLRRTALMPTAISSSSRNERPLESGPFGKSIRRRGQSRTRTTTPAEKKDQRDRDENIRAMDAAMNNLKERSKQASQRGNGGVAGALVQVSPPEQQEVLPPTQAAHAGQPVEVVVYGIPASIQYEALSFFERASGGCFYEEYNRAPPTQRFHSLSRSGHFGNRPLSDDALRKKNHYAGGDNWIKITFDSQEAADRACHASPHIIKGYLVHAEPYRGVFQRPDVAIPATDENIRSANASPSQDSSRTLPPNPSGSPTPSGTASSATATVAPVAPPAYQQQGQQELPASTTAVAPPAGQRPLRIRGAKRAVLLPAEQALLPAPSTLQKTLAVVPIIGWILSGGSELIGGSVPRRDDGGFDHAKASVWWRFWYTIDGWTGWDTCGVKSGLDD